MRPYVICHMCTTIDGKILVDRWVPLAGGQSERICERPPYRISSADGHLNLAVALDKLRLRFGIRRLMLEGGGMFNGAMLKAARM